MDNQELFLKDKINSYEEYRFLAAATMPDLGSYDKNQLHMNMGIMTEIGELADGFKKQMAYNKPLDLINVSEEWADIMWYVAGKKTIVSKAYPDSVDDFVFEVNSESTDFYRQNFKNDKKESHVALIAPAVFLNALYSPNGMWKFLNFMDYLGDRLGIDKMQALTNNINKLHFRYKGKFDEYLAQNRDLDTERKILENTHEVDLQKFADRADTFKRIL